MIAPRKLRILLPALGVFALLLVEPVPAPAQDGDKASATRSSGRDKATSAPQAKAARASAGRSATSTRRSTAPRSNPRGSDRPVVDTRRQSRRHGSGHGYRGHRRHSYGVSFGFGHYYPRHHYPFYYGYWDFYPYYYWGVPFYPRPYGYDYRRDRAELALGALDLNVRPKKAEVYLNGQYIGKVREFDGWPGHLWLERGTYELIFFFEGYGTQRRELTVYPGVVVDVELQLVAGESVPATELSRVPARAPDDSEAMTAVRSAYRSQQESTGREALDTRDAPGRLRLSVAPADASVYLDGKLLGSAEELAQLEAGLILDAGDHLLEVVRPGFATERRSFELESGDELKVDISLKSG